MSLRDICFIGTAEVPHGRYPDRTPVEIAQRLAKLVVEDAGIKKTDVDGILSAMAIMDSDYNNEIIFGRLPEAFGMRKNTRVTAVSVSGGGSSHALVQTGAGLLHSGECEVVMVVHAQRFTTFTGMELAEYFAKAGADPEWEIPFGVSFNALAAFIQQRYMYETGTTMEQIASVVVNARKWAMLQDNAMFNKKETSIAEVLNSKMVSTPITAFMCNVLCDGGSAFLMTTTENAKKLGIKKPVYILGEASHFSHRNMTVSKDYTSFDYGDVAGEAYKKAGLGPKDMNIAEVYGAYPIMSLIFLEKMGFCKKGEAGRFIMEGNTWPGGKLPMSTNGEAMSFGHTGTGVGIALFVESIRQLQGKAGRAQVPNARFLIENCGGGAFMDAHMTVMGNVLT